MFSARSGPHVDALSQPPAGRCGGAGAAARTGVHSPAVRLSPAAYPAQARGHRHEPQEAPAALPRGTAAGAPASGRKRALGTRAPMAMPQGPNQRWSLDFLSDAFADGRRFRILAIVDDFTRECLALVADTSLPGLRVVRELDALIARRGRPAMIVSDNGTELTSMAMLRWSQEHGSSGTTSRPASRSRMPSSRASTAGCATSCSTRRCSPRSPMPARFWRPGRTITTP